VPTLLARLQEYLGAGRGLVLGLAPNVMGLTSLGLEIDILCGFLYGVLIFRAILGLDFSGLALYPGRRRRPGRRSAIPAQPHAG
jgi:hypothetical protein